MENLQSIGLYFGINRTSHGTFHLIIYFTLFMYPFEQIFLLMFFFCFVLIPLTDKCNNSNHNNDNDVHDSMTSIIVTAFWFCFCVLLLRSPSFRWSFSSYFFSAYFVFTIWLSSKRVYPILIPSENSSRLLRFLYATMFWLWHLGFARIFSSSLHDSEFCFGVYPLWRRLC